jgi:VIT1/CCC1 family predicted Fe2+/Mn2+ transporter
MTELAVAFLAVTVLAALAWLALFITGAVRGYRSRTERRRDIRRRFAERARRERLTR